MAGHTARGRMGGLPGALKRRKLSRGGKKGGLHNDKGGLRSASSGAQAMGTGGGQ
jgi:hypothetical protein